MKERLRSLVIEDDPISRHLLEKTLSLWGTCESAIDGESGLEKFQSALTTEAPFNLVCLDIMMPGLDGLNVLTLLKNSDHEPAPEPTFIIMTTGKKDPQSVLSAFNQGADGYIQKPIDIKKLKSLLRKFSLLQADD